jgi:hypothetical protein
MPFSNRSKNLIALTFALAGVSVSLALALTVGSTEATPANAQPKHLSVLKPVDSEMIAALPPRAKTWLTATETTPYAGGQVSLLGSTSIEGGEIVVATVGNSTCALSLKEEVSACGETERVEDGEIFAASPSGCDAYTVIGMVPDGITELSVDRGADGKVEATLPVVSNVYQGTFESVHTVLRNAAGGVAINLPLSSYASMNDGCGK